MPGPSLFIRENCPLATPANDGLMSAAQAAAAASSSTAIADDDVEIFVDSTNGNDSNPGTQASPVQTFQKGWSLVAVMGRKKRRLYLAAGDYPLVGAPQPFDATFYVPPPLPLGEPLGVYGTPVDSGLGTLAVTVSANNSRLISAAPHVGTFVGAVLRFTSGACVGGKLLIQADDGTTFTLCNSAEWEIGFPVSPGDTFVIETPGSTISLAGGSGNGIYFNGGRLSLKDVAFDAPDRILFDQVEIVNIVNVAFLPTGSGFVAINDCKFSASAVPAGGYFDPQPFDLFLEGSACVFFKDTNIDIQLNSICGDNTFDTSAVFENCTIEVDRNSQLSMLGGGFAAINSNVLIDGGQFRSVGNDFSRNIWNGSPAGTDAVSAKNGSIVQFGMTDINNADGNAVFGSTGAVLNVGDLGGAGNGAGGTGCGLSLQAGTLAAADNDGAGNSACAVIGATGQVLVGATSKTYASMSGNLGFGETNAGGPTLNRFTIRAA